MKTGIIAELISNIKSVLCFVWTFVKGHPIITAMCVCVFAVVGAVAGTFVTYEIAHATSNPTFCKLCHAEEGTGPLTEYDT
jgi:nitrate/TMAO reductase-like tetraheme cytochrome c subunit